MGIPQGQFDYPQYAAPRSQTWFLGTETAALCLPSLYTYHHGIRISHNLFAPQFPLQKMGAN